MKIVELTGLSYPTVLTNIDLFEAGGWTALRPARRGRQRDRGRVLSAAQRDAVQRISIDKRPQQRSMDFFL